MLKLTRTFDTGVRLKLLKKQTKWTLACQLANSFAQVKGALWGWLVNKLTFKFTVSHQKHTVCIFKCISFLVKHLQNRSVEWFETYALHHCSLAVFVFPAVSYGLPHFSGSLPPPTVTQLNCMKLACLWASMCMLECLQNIQTICGPPSL